MTRPLPLTMRANEVGELVGYSPQYLRQLVRDGRFPPPIDPSLPAVSWRWSRRRVEQYVDEGTAVVA